jgi:primosomal protein N' (replication factor Y)
MYMSQLTFAQMQPSSDREASQKLATVVVPPLEGEYLYSYAALQPPSLAVGSIVTVPLGRRSVSGFVVSVDSAREQTSLREMEQRNIKVKSIDTTSMPIPGFDAEHLAFFEWMAKYYVEPLSQILDLAIPTPAFGRADPLLRITPGIEIPKLGASQIRIVEYLSSLDTWIPSSQVRDNCDASSATISSLVKKGVVTQRTSFEEPAEKAPTWSEHSLWDSLTDEQQTAARDITVHVKSGEFRSFLLHGVTGSGKTEVYLEAIIEALKLGKSALVMVPEIALTPQLTDRFEARLKQRIAVLHSNMKPRERWSHWTDLLTGKVKVVIGARSALFAPIKNVGIVVVDEEHDSSFKQGEGIRYQARDLALVRAKLSKCPVVLGSATPSLETFHNAKTGKHCYQSLSRRFFKSDALKYQLIDLSAIKPWEMPSKSISLPFLEGLRKTLARGEQAFVLYNRRGFASYLQCNKCEHVLGCPHCSVTLTYHRKPNSLLCHFCGFSSVPPVVCPGCGASENSDPLAAEKDVLFAQRGAGTERVHEELCQLLPSARIAKLDRDVAASLEDYTQVLSDVREKKIDILVGTQMIAKGHDLPLVTFVGVVDCDVGLHMPDFRAAERAFQLLTQVAGRAGRRERPGFVVLQTRVPRHASLQMTIASNYEGFAEIELNLRRELRYPPFQKLLRVVISAEDRAQAQRQSVAIASRGQTVASALSVIMLGPAPAPIEKVRNMWRYHILFKADSTPTLQHLMKKLKEENDAPKQIRVVFDIDPQDML